MKHKPLTLSLVIPVFNEEDHLRVCLDAIASQTILPDEVIVVDNNSTDRTLEIAKRYNFVTLLAEKKQGVLFARTKGFNSAQSDVIGRIDADSILPVRWVEHVKEFFSDESLSATTGPVNYYDMPFPETNHHPDHLMRRSIYNWSPKSPFLFGSNMAIRASVWKKIQPALCSGTYMHEDLDLAVHLYQTSEKILYSKKLLCGASGRRYNDTPRKFYTYMSMYRQTYLRHGLHSLAIYSATGVYWLGYMLVHPWIKIWYRLYSFSRPLVPISQQARKNPMHN